MKKLFSTSKDEKHGEIVSRLDRIIGLLSDLRKDSLVEEAVAEAAKEYYTNDDLCRILRVSKRTLARYRQQKLIGYYMVRGKVYYKVAEVQSFLKKKGKIEPE